MNREVLALTYHAMKRFKERGKVKSISKMYRRTYQAYEKGILIAYNSCGTKFYLFNDMLFIFNRIDDNSLLLLTLYKVNQKFRHFKSFN